jgi:flagellar hook-length control protein FliK
MLKKLGMDDEDIEMMMDIIPEDMLENLVQVVQDLPQMAEMSLGNMDAKEQLTEVISNLSEVLTEITQELSSDSSTPVEILTALESLNGKLENAQINLENMNSEDFGKVLEEVQQIDLKESDVQQAGKAEVEIVEIKSVENQPEESVQKTEDGPDTVKEAKVETQPQENQGEQSSESKEQGTEQAAAVESTTAEQTPGQVDQSFAEMMKVENNIIKSAQPMELASARVRLSQNVMNQVLDGTKLQLNPTENGQQIILKLRPEELGNVDLKLTVDKGVLMAEFNVESQIVKETLESNMADLKQALAEKGYNIEGMQVSVGQEQTEQQSQFENRFFNQNTQRKYFFGSDDEMVDFESINKSLAGLQSTFEYLG